MVDRIDRINRKKIGRSNWVFIHFQSHVQLFSSRKQVRAMTVTMWMMVMAQGWTEARARGVKMSRA